MKQILSIYKPVGLTPLQLINKLKEEHPDYSNEKITYAGRLDPLAHGVMLLLIGDEAKNRDHYLNLPKEYKFEIVIGLETDTYDILGLLNTHSCHSRVGGNLSFLDPRLHGDDKKRYVNIIVNSFVNKHVGKQEQTYPPFSSKAVDGKPLFWWAKQKKLHEITIPTREIEIYDFKLLSINSVIARKNDEAISSNSSQLALQEIVKQNISTVQGDFRQKEILERWKHFFLSERRDAPSGASRSRRPFITAKFKINCSSGTYVRSLAHALGKELGVGAITLDILRTKVGDYSIKDALRLP